MILNYIKITLRYLWRNRLFTALNILGLSIGICACWTIFRIVDYEFSFDKKHPEGERIYQIVNRSIFEGEEGGFGGVPLGILPSLDVNIEGLESVAPVYSQYMLKVELLGSKGSNQTIEEPEHIIATLPSYFEMVPYQWLLGNPASALDAPDHVVLTESRARQYFPNLPIESIVHQSLTYYSMNDTVVRHISGVVKDLDYPSSFTAKEFYPVSKDDLASTVWMGMNSRNTLFVKVKENHGTKAVLDFINKKNEELTREFREKFKYEGWFEALSLQQKHFAAEYSGGERTANKNVLYGLIGIAFFLLTLAGINYINLTTAQLPQRSKEIGVRKTLGSSPRALTTHFMVETFAIVLFAFLLAVPLSFLFSKTFDEFIPEGLTKFDNYSAMIFFAVGLLSLITFFSALYPAWLITKVRTVNVLKGQGDKIRGARLSFRKALIIFQFVIAQVFIIGALIIGQQLQYTLQKDMGFNYEAVITANIPYKSLDRNVDPHLFKQKLEKYPEISAISLGHLPLNNSVWGNVLFFEKDTAKTQVSVNFKYGDEDYLDFYKFNLIAGRHAVPADSTNEYIVNEALVKAFGFENPQQAIGQLLYDAEQKAYPIVGVVADFHQHNFKSKIEPLVIVTSTDQLNSFNIKLSSSHPAQWNETIKSIEKEWKTIYPNSPFEFKFYDETIENLYETEQKTAKLITLATTVCIIISCLGLFGLATLTAFQRTKEIGVRKVLGASISGIVRLLSTDFVKLVLIAILIASPIAWWAMNRWLENFAYRIEIKWWMFVMAGILAVVIALLTVSSRAIKAAVANPVDSLRDE